MIKLIKRHEHCTCSQAFNSCNAKHDNFFFNSLSFKACHVCFVPVRIAVLSKVGIVWIVHSDF